MLSKNLLYKEFQKEPEKYWRVPLFEEQGFVRRVCKICGKGFWSIKELKNCPEHDLYGFIGKPISGVKWDFLKTWREFEKFFEKKDHKSIKRYPVVSKWHPNLFFTIASIQDFIRIDASLSFEYPENPLIVPQMCLRFNDISNVGVTGKHLTCFMMGGQHSFLDGSKKSYWKEKCMDLNFEFLTKKMKIPKEEIIYLEDFWAMPDFSAFGPTIEAHSKGLELVNNVFMEFSSHGSSYKELKVKVVDVGWGIERLSWFTKGLPNIYEVAFGDVMNKLREMIGLEYDEDFLNNYAIYAGQLNIEDISDLKEARKMVASKLNVSIEEVNKKISPLEALYAIADHSRALAFAISDGALVSNVGGGYNLRVILRRALSFLENFGWHLELEEVALFHVKYLKKIFPELKESEDEIVKIIKVEKERYKQAKQNAERIIRNLDKSKISEEDLIKLYESHGITPEQLGIDVPKDFYKNITERHLGYRKVEEKKYAIDVEGLPPTKILYYKEPAIFKFRAKILKISGKYVILDQTAFYPESGGQKSDNGYIENIKVLNVQKIGKVIVHELDGELNKKVGDLVFCEVDKKRREILTKHHDAIHVISGAARKVLGKHIHQFGAEKDVDKARIDLTHFENLNQDQIKKIEDLANQIVKKNLSIKKIIMDRGKAESKYGFDIYAGGYVPSKQIRIINIGNGFDIEACSGTHGNRTKDIGWIKIIKSKRVADGLVRLEIVAGDLAENFLREKEKILKLLSKELGVNEEKVPLAVENLFKKWKELRKRLRG